MDIPVVNATTIEAWRTEASDLFATNAIGVVSFTVLVYDHIITFSTEVDVIWKKSGNRGLLVYLFIILRYLAPLGFTVQLCSYFFSPEIWTPDICRRYVVFEGCMTVTALGIVSLMMFLRVFALYGRSWKIAVSVLSLFVFQFVVQGWLLSHAVPVVRSKGIYPAGCSMLFAEEVGVWAPASAYFPIIYDTVIFVLTFYKTIAVLRNRRNKPSQGEWIMRALLRDGALFYFVMLLTNVPLVIMIALCSPGIRNIAAQWEFLITVTIMCRITLSLRQEDAAWSIGTTATQLARTTLFFEDPQDGRPKGRPRRASVHEVDDGVARRRSKCTGKRITSSLPPTPNLDEESIELEMDIGTWKNFTQSQSSSGTTVAVHVPAHRRSKDDDPPTVDLPTTITETGEDEMDGYFAARRRRIADEESEVGSAHVTGQFRSFSTSSLGECEVSSGRNTAVDRRYDVFVP